MGKIKITKYNDHLYNFEEVAVRFADKPAYGYVDAWLYLGSKRAALFDALDTAPDLYEQVRQLTSLPVDVFLSHGHSDHVGTSLSEFADAGCNIYMNMDDQMILPDHVNAKWLTPLHDGEIFSLGDRSFEVLSCAGHTAGSVIFLDRDHEIVFSGDTLGSGRIWLQLPYSSPLSVCRENFTHIAEQVSDFKNLQILPGHVCQATVFPMNQGYLEDLIHCIDDVLSGNAVTQKQMLDFENLHYPFLTAAYGQMIELSFPMD